MRILHLEDNPADSLLIERLLEGHGLQPDVIRAGSIEEFRRGLEERQLDAVLIDNGLPGFDGPSAVRMSKGRNPSVPVIVCSGSATGEDIASAMREGAADYVDKQQLWRLVPALQKTRTAPFNASFSERLGRQHAAMSRLVGVVQELSLARDLSAVTTIVRRAARELTHADGATFVLREGEQCFYADEDAISPLWKGQRFALNDSISGWAIRNARPIAIEDVLNDDRVSADFYRPTFVKSLVMAPIRTAAPLGAIGVYWASRHACTADELMLLEALANTTAVAMVNVQVFEELESRVRSRTRELQDANRELEAFTYAVSHDLRAPLRALSGELGMITEDFGDLNLSLSARISSARGHVSRMYDLIDDLLRLSGITRRELKIERFDLSRLADEIIGRLRNLHPTRLVNVRIERGVLVDADQGLMMVLMENLLSNAWKYTSHQAEASIEFRTVCGDDGLRVFQVLDNGAGFDQRYAKRLFEPFQRLHRPQEFAGTGVGLATVQRIVRRHDGEVWGESPGPELGSTFSFTLGSGANADLES